MESGEKNDRSQEERRFTETSVNVRRARRGDRDSLEWVVRRFSAVLLATARYRLGPTLRHLYEPEDLVEDVWVITLPRLPDLEERRGRETPVLLEFLSTTLRYRINDLMRRELARQAKGADLPNVPGNEMLDQVRDEATGIVTRVVRGDVGDRITESLERLSEKERELVILRGVEQHRYRDIGTVLGCRHETLPPTYRRALTKLRQWLPESIFGELIDD